MLNTSTAIPRAAPDRSFFTCYWPLRVASRSVCNRAYPRHYLDQQILALPSSSGDSRLMPVGVFKSDRTQVALMASKALVFAYLRVGGRFWAECWAS